MKAAGIVDFGTDLRNPNFAKMAEAAGLLGSGPKHQNRFVPMIEQALNMTACLSQGPGEPAGTLHATNDYCRPGERLWPIHA